VLCVQRHQKWWVQQHLLAGTAAAHQLSAQPAATCSDTVQLQQPQQQQQRVAANTGTTIFPFAAVEAT